MRRRKMASLLHAPPPTLAYTSLSATSSENGWGLRYISASSGQVDSYYPFGETFFNDDTFWLVNAETGTAKTTAYLAPIIHYLQDYNPRIQRADGTLGISILVARPGRLFDHLKNTASYFYTRLRWIVFDGADRILELGFGKEIEEILKLPAKLNKKVNELAKICLENPVMISLEDKIVASHLQCLHHVDFETLNHVGVDETLSLKSITRSVAEDYNLPTQLTQPGEHIKLFYDIFTGTDDCSDLLGERVMQNGQKQDNVHLHDVGPRSLRGN